MNSPLTVVCDGCSSNFRKQLVKFPDVVAKSRFVGVIVKGKMPFEGYGHVFLCNPAPVLSYRVRNTKYLIMLVILINCCNRSALKKFVFSLIFLNLLLNLFPTT